MGLMFDNIDLEATYGLVVDGASTWPKPERDVEYIHVPGRNGDILMDNGCWQNVEITYSFLIKDGWKTKFENFAAWLCSHVGYFRLEDQERHPGVYRMASFTGPIEPELWFTTDTGVFELTFNCKPQQWLLSGEQYVGVMPVLSEYTSHLVQSNDKNRTTPFLAASEGMVVKVRITAKTQAASVRVDMRGAFVTLSGGSWAWGVANSSFYQQTESIAAGATVEYSHTITAADLNGGGLTSILIGFQDQDSYAYVKSIIIELDGVEYTATAVTSSNFKASKTISNPTAYNSQPLIKVGSGTARVGTFTLTIADPNTGQGDWIKAIIDIDCELEDTYYTDANGNLVSANKYVSITNSNKKERKDFPYFKPGNNTFSVNSANLSDWAMNCAFISIIPRWYRI